MFKAGSLILTVIFNVFSQLWFSLKKTQLSGRHTYHAAVYIIFSKMLSGLFLIEE